MENLARAKEVITKEKSRVLEWRANDGGLTWAAGDFLATIEWLEKLLEEETPQAMKSILEKEIEDTLHNDSYEIALFLDVLGALEG